MTQTIEQLTARVRELEEENARLKAECDDIKQVQFPRKLDAVAAGWKKQLAASQLHAEQLREVLIDNFYFLERHSNRWDGVNGKHPNDIAESTRAILAIPRDTSALDAYVAKRLHDMACDKGLLRIQVEELTRQRDLAVEALEKWDMFFGSDAETAVLTIAEDPSTLTGCQKATKESLSAIKESEAK